MDGQEPQEPQEPAVSCRKCEIAWGALGLGFALVIAAIAIDLLRPHRPKDATDD